MRQWFVRCLILIMNCAVVTSCIEPPLKLPAEEVIVDMPTVITDIEVVWNLDIDWQTSWHYGWDAEDERLWGNIEYPIPTNYEVRRYYLGDVPSVPHTNVEGFTIYSNRFRRSYQFGYYDLLVDYRGIPVMQQFAPVVLDCTHSLQQPNQSSGVTGGRPALIETIARAGVAVGVDGLFLETHFDPANAKSDGANMLPLDRFDGLMERLTVIRQAVMQFQK